MRYAGGMTRRSAPQAGIGNIVDALLRPEQVAELLGCSARYVRLLLARGDLAYVRIGRLRRVPRDAVAAYVRERMVARGGC